MTFLSGSAGQVATAAGEAAAASCRSPAIPPCRYSATYTIRCFPCRLRLVFAREGKRNGKRFVSSAPLSVF
jgi:hypothetical protein